MRILKNLLLILSFSSANSAFGQDPDAPVITHVSVDHTKNSK